MTRYVTVEYTEKFSHTFTFEIPDDLDVSDTYADPALDAVVQAQMEGIMDLGSDLSGYPASAHDYAGYQIEGVSVDAEIPRY